MRRLIPSVLLVALLCAVFPLAASGDITGATLATAKVTNPTQAEATGYVHVTNDDDSIYVKFWMKAGYCVYDMAVDVAADLADIPQSRGGAIPGKFAHKCDPGCVTMHTFTISLGDEGVTEGDTVYIAAHGIVRFPDGTEEGGWAVRSDQAAVTQFPGRNWSTYLLYTIQ